MPEDGDVCSISQQLDCLYESGMFEYRPNEYDFNCGYVKGHSPATRVACIQPQHALATLTKVVLKLRRSMLYSRLRLLLLTMTMIPAIPTTV
jgi:hypothetical protein